MELLKYFVEGDKHPSSVGTNVSYLFPLLSSMYVPIYFIDSNKL